MLTVDSDLAATVRAACVLDWVKGNSEVGVLDRDPAGAESAVREVKSS